MESKNPRVRWFSCVGSCAVPLAILSGSGHLSRHAGRRKKDTDEYVGRIRRHLTRCFEGVELSLLPVKPFDGRSL